MTATRAQAMTDMVKTFTDYWGVDDVQVPGKPYNPPKPSSTRYARVIIEHTEGGQGSLANAEGKRRWTRSGLGTISLYFPLNGDVNAASDAAEEVEQLYQGKRTEHDVWFRNVRTVEDTDFNTWYKLDVLFEFEYDNIV